MPYDALAPMYDRLMSFVEYDEWVGLVGRVLDRYCDLGDPCILEIGAGTGVVGSALMGRGYRYTASDLSPAMCAVARNRRDLPAVVADGRYLPFKEARFDAALFLYDGINYLMTPGDYRSLFASVNSVLTYGGLFLFDVTTRANSTAHFMDYLDFNDYGDMSYVRHSYFDARRAVQHNDFTIYRSSGEDSQYYEKFVENHRQKVYSIPEIERMIPKRHFEVLGIWDGYTFRRYSGKSKRVHFLLRKV